MVNVILNLVLFTVKFIGGKLSNSVSVISDAFNNLTDAVTTMFAWLGLKISSVGAGETHPNGHGRFEWVIALLSASSVIVIGWELFRNSVAAIKSSENTVFGVFTVIVLALSIAVKIFMYFYNTKKSKENNSAALKAVAVDSLSDAAATAVVLIALIVNAIFSLKIDGWCGILVSLFIIYNGFRSFTDTVELIMGRSASKEQLNEMRDFAMENEAFKDICDLQIEDYGYGRFRVSMTAVGKDEVSPERFLAAVTELRYRIFEKYGYNAQITAENNAAQSENGALFIEGVLASFDVPLRILSQRFNQAEKYTVISLELGIDFMDNMKKKELEKELAGKLMSAPEGYKIIPQIRLHADEKHYKRRKRHRKATA